MNAWDTYMYRAVPPALSGRTKEKPDKPDITSAWRKAAVLFSVVHLAPIHLPQLPAPLPPLWVHVKIPLALLMTCGSKQKRVAEQERHKINRFIYSFFYSCITSLKCLRRGCASLATWTGKRKKKNAARFCNQFLSCTSSSPQVLTYE